MLLSALKARLPLLRATTTDTVNLHDVLLHLAPELKLADWGGPRNLNTAEVFVATAKVEVTDTWYQALAEQGKTLLLINQDDESGLSINVGEVPVPSSLIRELIEEITDDAKQAYKLLPAFRGLTLKSASEVIRLVLTHDKALSIPAVLRERARMVGKLKGLSLVETNTLCYLPDDALAAWVKVERPYFEGATDARLIPRGLLFCGIPGTGKTQGAKYIARELGVPLYRLDMASSLAKWVGESEANFGRVLSMLDQEEPCVFLIDEVEKLFESGEDSGTTSRILSQLLWWLQEHTSRILTIMTTNNLSALPGELYRRGRIDRTMTFGALKGKPVNELAAAVCTSLKVAFSTELKNDLACAVSECGKVGITPAEITQVVFDYVKQNQKCLGG
jgi:ATPase family associated with various cellular activities (AAA)